MSASNPDSNTPLNVAFVYVYESHKNFGPEHDGWARAHEQGRRYLENQLQEQVNTRVIDQIPPEEAAGTFRELARGDADLIVGADFGYMDPLKEVAAEFRDVVFMHCGGFKTEEMEIAENLGTYFGRIYQSYYLCGMAAGLQTETDLIGVATGFPIPETYRTINAATLGARRVNPEVETDVVWTNGFYQPPVEREAAEHLVNNGADVLISGQNSAALLQTAQDRGAWATGWHVDMREFAPEATLTSAEWNWGPYYVETVQKVLDGQWKMGGDWHGFAEGMVDVSPLAEFLPSEGKDLIRQTKDRLISGEDPVFQGPVKDRDGNLRVKQGQNLDTNQLRSMDWMVEGVREPQPLRG